MVSQWKWLLHFLLNFNGEFMGLHFTILTNHNWNGLAIPQHDVELIDIGLDGKLLAWTENVDGYSKLYVKDLED